MLNDYYIYPPSNDRSGLHYRCSVCNKIMVRFEYYMITMLGKPTGFVCSPLCCEIFIAQRLKK